MVTSGYPFWHSEDDFHVGTLDATRPMSYVLEPLGSERDILISEHGYQLDVWEPSVTLVELLLESRITGLVLC